MNQDVSSRQAPPISSAPPSLRKSERSQNFRNPQGQLERPMEPMLIIDLLTPLTHYVGR
jgi:hypothetical protein